MSTDQLKTGLKRRRRESGLSQEALAARVGVTRQAIIAIEAERQVPSTVLALSLARELGCSVETLFRLRASGERDVRLAAGGDDVQGQRALLGRVDSEWVAHAVPADAGMTADGLIRSVSSDSCASVEPFGPDENFDRNVLVAGCAPLLGALAQRVQGRFRDARLCWLLASSNRALDLLEDGLLHIAGIHLVDDDTCDANARVVSERFGEDRMMVVNLVRWRQGFVVEAGNPHGISTIEDIVGRGLRFVRRDAGAGATKLVSRALRSIGANEDSIHGPLADGHDDVARRVACGAADVGVAIEGVALAHGLNFVPLSEERFDLVVPARRADDGPVARVLEAIDTPSFRREVDHIPGYDASMSGHVTTIDPARDT